MRKREDSHSITNLTDKCHADKEKCSSHTSVKCSSVEDDKAEIFHQSENEMFKHDNLEEDQILQEEAFENAVSENEAFENGVFGDGAFEDGTFEDGAFGNGAIGNGAIGNEKKKKCAQVINANKVKEFINEKNNKNFKKKYALLFLQNDNDDKIEILKKKKRRNKYRLKFNLNDFPVISIKEKRKKITVIKQIYKEETNTKHEQNAKKKTQEEEQQEQEELGRGRTLEEHISNKKEELIGFTKLRNYMKNSSLNSSNSNTPNALNNLDRMNQLDKTNEDAMIEETANVEYVNDMVQADSTQGDTVFRRKEKTHNSTQPRAFNNINMFFSDIFNKTEEGNNSNINDFNTSNIYEYDCTYTGFNFCDPPKEPEDEKEEVCQEENELDEAQKKFNSFGEKVNRGSYRNLSMNGKRTPYVEYNSGFKNKINYRICYNTANYQKLKNSMKNYMKKMKTMEEADINNDDGKENVNIGNGSHNGTCKCTSLNSVTYTESMDIIKGRAMKHHSKCDDAKGKLNGNIHFEWDKKKGWNKGKLDDDIIPEKRKNVTSSSINIFKNSQEMMTSEESLEMEGEENNIHNKQREKKKKEKNSNNGKKME